jgi:hypothetical protein
MDNMMMIMLMLLMMMMTIGTNRVPQLHHQRHVQRITPQSTTGPITPTCTTSDTPGKSRNS